MSASERKVLVRLALLCLIVAAADAKTLTKREAKNYFEEMLNELEDLKNIPILGEALEPYITEVTNAIKGLDEWSEGSLSSVVNSVAPCRFNRFVLKCSGKVDRESLHVLIKKIISSLPAGNSVLPMLEIATKMMV